MSQHVSRFFSRRDALVALGASGATLVGCAHPTLAKAAPPPPGPNPRANTAPPPAAPLATSPPALAGAHTVVPLPFKATALNGISERMITSHHENNYAGAVKNLN